eukprot:4627124-Pyramimonas_sp.AAC.1
MFAVPRKFRHAIQCPACVLRRVYPTCTMPCTGMLSEVVEDEFHGENAGLLLALQRPKRYLEPTRCRETIISHIH